ncbi:hypothetical protein D623_10014494 [Myotis brandtii]|uniref:Uncharacterized protein n=1 Tax=Myotis brandtii TaxID=109478 RepID=S7NJI9_MYOBR|nr:hypothetical protein D623_10014494 [Myotis brandtii]
MTNSKDKRVAEHCVGESGRTAALRHTPIQQKRR